MKRILVLASALALAACSSGGSTPDGGTGTTGTTGTTGSTGTHGTSGSSGSTSSSSSGGTTGSADGGPYAIPGMAADVTVSFDSHDIPHIHCTGLNDCVRVQGYIHAKDRFFEMDLERHLSEGRISELVGSAGLSEDEFFRTVFVTRDGTPIATALNNALDGQTQALLQAYADGVNAYLAQARAGNLPINGEYADLGILPVSLEDWTTTDSLALGRLIQWELSETLDQETNFGQIYGAMTPSEIRALANPRQIDPVYTIQGFPFRVGPPPMPRGPSARTATSVQARSTRLKPQLDMLSRWMASFVFPLDKHMFTGSNDWVVDAAHSASGASMVANDPHLPLQYPPNFFLSQLIADTEGVNVLGSSFPGIPGALTGRGAHVGWGVTVVGYDVTDLYDETLPDPTHVTFNGQSVPLTVINENITVRNFTGAATTQPFTVQIVPHHGPLLAAPVNGHAISMRWTGHEITADVRALRNLIAAASVPDAFTALKDWGTGAQNFVLADDQGHIGFDPHALVPARPWAVDGTTSLPWAPLPGDGTAEWGYSDGGTWIPDSDLPQSQDPAWGYLMTANSDPVGVTDDNDVLNDKYYMSFAFDDQTGLRAGRITEMLQGFIADAGVVSQANMEAIQSDHAVILGRYLVPVVDSALAAQPAADPDGGLAAAVATLDQWASDGYDCPTGLTDIDPNGAADTDPVKNRDSAGCLMFHAFLRTLMHDIYADDEAFYGFQPDQQLELKALVSMNQPGAADTTLCDDRTTAGVVETCQDMTIKALTESRALIVGAYTTDPTKWIWGKGHTLTLTPPLPSSSLPGFTTDPFARPGGAFSVDVGLPDNVSLAATDPSALDFAYSAGGNQRWVGLMDGSASRMQLPGYQVDVPYAAPPTGLLNDWLRNIYFDFPRTQAEITAAQASTITFTPAP